MTQKLINYLMVLFAFTLPISLGATNAVLGLMLLLWIIEGDFNRKIVILKQEKIVWIFLSIGLLTLLSAFFSDSMSHSFLAGEKKSLIRVILSHYILVPFIIIIFITSVKEKYLNSVISAFLLAILISVIVSYLIYFQVIDVSYLQSKHLLRESAKSYNPVPFMNRTEYSVFLSIAAILLLDKLLHAKNRYLQFFILLLFTSVTINLFINGGRTGQISFILAISIYIFFYFKFNIKTIIATLAVLSILLTSAYTFSSTFHTRSHQTLSGLQKLSEGNFNTNLGLRVASTKVTLDYLTSSPIHFLLGAGAGDSRQLYLDHAKNNFGKNVSEPIKILAHVHNQYLEYWMDGTILSLILFLLYFFLLTQLPLSASMKPSLYAFTIIIAFACLTDITLFRYQPAMLYFLVSSYFIVKAKKYNESITSI